MTKIWMVRAGKGGFLIEKFLSENVVGLGWNIGDLTNIDNIESIKSRLRERFPEDNESAIGNKAGKIFTFRSELNVGDYVVSNDSEKNLYYIGEILSDYFYDANLISEIPGDYGDLRYVNWLGSVNRDELSKSTRDSLGSPGTIFEIKEPDFEEIFELLLNSEAKKFLQSFKEESEKLKKDYNEFLTSYPFKEDPEKIDSLKPDDIYDKGNPPYFLYYIEHKLSGSIFVGKAQYAVNAREHIDELKKLLKIVVDDSKSITEKVDAPWEKIKYWGGDKHLAKKIVFLYNPEKVLPSYKTEHLEYFAALFDSEFKSKPTKFNIDYDDLSIGQKFEYLNQLILNFKNDKIITDMDNESFGHFLYRFSHPDSKKHILEEKQPELKDDLSAKPPNPNQFEGEIGIKKFIETVLGGYKSARASGARVRGHKISDSFNEFAHKLKEFANSSEFTGDPNRYYTRSVHFGQTKFVSGPYVYLEDRISRYNIYIGYMFREDMNGVYLSLNNGAGTSIKKFEPNEENFSSDEEFKELYINNLRKELNKKTELPEEFKKSSEGAWFIKSTIYAKYYEKNELPSEEQLTEDLRDMIGLYKLLVDPHGEIPDSPEKDKIKYIPEITFFEFLKENGYFFDPKLVENFLLSLKVKPFVILTGNSGTGKTKVAQLFAQYLNSPIEEEYHNKKHEIVPVGANWTENRHVVGFYNVLTEDYQGTQALNLILDASDNFEEYGDLSEPYFLILDEMNLSHVERYFSDFLSVMESQEAMHLHDNIEEVVPNDLELPKNLMVVGTVNVDETTYMFSPKVLDRANTIEFLTHNPLGYMQSEFNIEEPSGNIDYLQNPLSDIDPDVREFSIDDLRQKMEDIKTTDNKFLWDEISSEIEDIYNKLKKAGFDFGFRVVNEIMRFMYVAWKYEGEPDTWENWERYFDAQIKQKMLPKLHGSQRTLQEVIKSLFEICYGIKIEKDPRLISYADINESKYPTAALKLREMDKVLYDQRYVAFIN